MKINYRNFDNFEDMDEQSGIHESFNMKRQHKRIRDDRDTARHNGRQSKKNPYKKRRSYNNRWEDRLV